MGGPPPATGMQALGGGHLGFELTALVVLGGPHVKSRQETLGSIALEFRGALGLGIQLWRATG